MARENLVILLGSVAMEPLIKNKPGEESTKYAMVYINVGRGVRDVGDGRKLMHCDDPMIMTRDPKLVEEISKWHTYDIVLIKGTIATKQIKKASHCTFCGVRNVITGMLVYVYPTYAKKWTHFDSADECLRFIADNREISNLARIFGTLVKDPSQITTKAGLRITQYPIAMYRKLKIRSDPPAIRADYPWVKSYGAIADEDMKRLYTGSEIMVDGCLQTRLVLRHIVCGVSYDKDGKPEKDEDGNPRMRAGPSGKPEGCGRTYDWKDRAMEVVPYSVEYERNYRGDEEEEEKEEENDS